MTHLRTFHYDDRDSLHGGPNNWCVWCRQLDGATYQAGTEPTLPIHQPRHDPYGNMEGKTGWCECFYAETYVDDHDPYLTKHTHHDLLDLLNYFDPWLDQMDKQLSVFAQTLLEIGA